MGDLIMLKSNIWTEELRPDELDDIVGQDDIIKRLKNYISSGEFQHLLFAGPPGVGKTTAAIALSKKLFDDDWGGNFMELNGSDERGIGVIRNKVKAFAKTAPLGDIGFKIVFLDEADHLTNDAQAALRRMMEKYSSSCIFILSCNYSSKIVEPIQSRCAIYRFKPINSEHVKNHIMNVVKSKGVKINEDAVEAIVYIAEGDMRKAVNSLQASYQMIDENNDTITVEMVYVSRGLAKEEYVEELISTSLQGDFMKAVTQMDTLLINDGLTGYDLVGQMVRVIMKMNVPDKVKVRVVDSIGEQDFRMSEGANETVQIKALLAKFVIIGEIDIEKVKEVK